MLTGLAVVAWVVTVDRMQGMDMGPGTELGGLGWFAGVWTVMMAGMMLPSLSPMAIAYSRGAEGGRVGTSGGTVLFAGAYLIVWVVVGLVAYAVIGGVRSLDLGFLGWDKGGRYVAGGVIAGAGLYELSSAKASCLRH